MQSEKSIRVMQVKYEKFHIYCSCLHDEKLSFDSFLILLKEKLNIQKEIAFKNKSITTFQKSFQNIF